MKLKFIGETSGYTTDYPDGTDLKKHHTVDFEVESGEFESIVFEGFDWSSGNVYVEYKPRSIVWGGEFNDTFTKFTFKVGEFMDRHKFEGSELTVNVRVKGGKVPVEVKFDLRSLENVTTDIDDSETFHNGDIVTFITDSGYQFNQLRFSGWDYSIGGKNFSYVYSVGDSQEFFNDDLTEFNFSVDHFSEVNPNMRKITLKVVATVDEVEIPEESGYSSKIMSIYSVSESQLVEFNKMRWNPDISFNEMIYSLYLLPFKLPDDVLSETSVEVNAGNIDMGFKAPIFTNDKLRYDGGTIKIPLEYNNVYDYESVVCKLHAPFIEPLILDEFYVIDSEISVFYIVDLLNKVTNIYVRSSKTGDIIDRREIGFTRDIPFLYKDNQMYNQDIGNYIYNEVLTPYIEVIRNEPFSDSEGLFGRNTNEYGVIGDYDGYLEVSKVQMNTDATVGEQERILQLLNNGVIIK